MAKKPKIFEDLTNILADASDAISDEVKKQQIALFFREKQKDLDDLRETRKRVQAENREKVKEAEPSTTDINYTGALVKHLRKKGVKGMGRFTPGTKPKLKDPGDGDFFGEGKAEPGREPWMPVDMKRKDKDGKPVTYERGQGGKLTFSDTQPGSSRFVADFETKEFKEKWIKDQLEQRGYTTDGGPQGPGYGRAKSEVEAMWRKQRSQWLQKKTDFLLGELREQIKNKKPAAVAPSQAAAPEEQVADAEASQSAKASAAAASPVKKPERVLTDGYSYGETLVHGDNGKSYRYVFRTDSSGKKAYVDTEYSNAGPDTFIDPTQAPWLNGKKTFTSDDGKIKVEADVEAGRYTNPSAAAVVANYNSAHPKAPQGPAPGTRVGSNGWYTKSGGVFFGSQAEYEKFKKKQGVV